MKPKRRFDFGTRTYSSVALLSCFLGFCFFAFLLYSVWGELSAGEGGEEEVVKGGGNSRGVWMVDGL